MQQQNKNKKQVEKLPKIIAACWFSSYSAEV